MIRLPRVPVPARPLRPQQRAVLFAAGLLLLYAAVALRPTSNPSARSGRLPAGAATSAAPGLFSFGNVLVLLLLGGGGAYALHLRRKGGVPGTAAPLRSLGALTVGTGGQVRLVRCAGDVLLLGVTAQGITVLQRYDAAAYDAATAPTALPSLAAGTPDAPAEATPAFEAVFAEARQAASGDGFAGDGALAPVVPALAAPRPAAHPPAPKREWSRMLPPVAPLGPVGPFAAAPRADA